MSFEVIGAITRRKTMMRVFAMSGIYNQTFLEVAQHLGANIAIRKPANREELKSWIPAIHSVLKAEGEMGIASGTCRPRAAIKEASKVVIVAASRTQFVGRERLRER